MLRRVASGLVLDGGRQLQEGEGRGGLGKAVGAGPFPATAQALAAAGPLVEPSLPGSPQAGTCLWWGWGEGGQGGLGPRGGSPCSKPRRGPGVYF